MSSQESFPAERVVVPLPRDAAPVAVTRWTVRLADPNLEATYRASRLADDRRRFQFVLCFVGLTAALNIAGDVYAIRYLGLDLGWGLVPHSVMLAAAAAAILLVAPVSTPRALQRFTIAFAILGIACTFAVLCLHPRLGAIWPTVMAGVLIIIYFCLPLPFTTMVVLAAGYTLIVPLTFILSVGPAPPPDDIYRAALRLMLANVLGLSVASTLQRSQRMQFAQNRLLQQLLSTDSLTGISNRRHFDHALTDEWRRCARARTPLSLLMIDVDHFKAYNDRCGHLQGDECLRRVAGLLTQAARRPGDLVARYGGEEFVCLLTDTNATGALLVAGRLQAAIDQARIPHPASPLGPHLTVSIGAATAHPPAESPEALVALADRLLYAAKERGRRGIAGGDVGDPAQGGLREARVA
jgi:diguanylate cyclase (GGDEF)-like protein